MILLLSPLASSASLEILTCLVNSLALNYGAEDKQDQGLVSTCKILPYKYLFEILLFQIIEIDAKEVEGEEKVMETYKLSQVISYFP